MGKPQTMYLIGGLRLDGEILGEENYMGLPALQLADNEGFVMNVFKHAIATVYNEYKPRTRDNRPMYVGEGY